MKYKLKEDYNAIVFKLDGFKGDLQSLFDLDKAQDIGKFEAALGVVMRNAVTYMRTVLESDRKYDHEADILDEILKYDGDYFGRSAFYRPRNGLEVVEFNNGLLNEKFKRIELLKNYLLIASELDGTLKVEVKSVQDKLDFILDALHIVFDTEDFYSTTHILGLGAINYRSDEPKDLAEDLKRRKYATERNYGSDHIKLTVKGASYVERRKKTKRKGSSKKWQEEVNQKLDSILEHIKKQDLGQEIIYEDLNEEIQELKILSKSLKKKTWFELLKGKLFDMAASEVINKKIAAEIFESLSDGVSSWIDLK